MADRLDVRRMLLKRGWTERRICGPLKRGDAVWASHGARDSSLSTYGEHGANWTIGFSADVPARVIVAACEAAADQEPRP